MPKQIVTLVGRTNVGKSTLFNRLVGKRKSITEDIHGVTRDRLYDKVTWLSNEFILEDTGGLDISNKETMNVEVKDQVNKALDEASLLLFVVDGKEGLSPYDYEIANEIRKHNKPVIIVVNKIDTHNTPEQVYEFYQLGFDSLCVVSAENSYGLGDLLDEIISFLDKDDLKEEDKEQTKIAIIGKPNAGKSSLVNLLLNEERMIVTDIAGTTRDAVDSYWQYNGKDYVLIDTAGLRRKNKVKESLEYYSVRRTLDAVDQSDICLFLIDQTVGITEQDAKIAGYAHDNKKAIIIAVNKWDLSEKTDKLAKKMREDIITKLSFMRYAPIVFISVKEKIRIKKLLDTIEKINENYSKRVTTGILNDILQKALLMSPPPSYKGKRLKIFYMSQVGVRPPVFLINVNSKQLMHFSYLRYLENQIRENYDFEGVPFIFKIKERGEE